MQKKNVANAKDPVAELEKNPTQKNWEAAQKKILKEGRYYYPFYPSGVKGKGSLNDAYVVIYDKGYKSLYRLPIMRKTGKGVEGATWFLKGLEINRRLMK
jgi:hypothetical protein